ncbi:peptidase [Clostridium acetobutylicum]|nr:peptidase [Clostridium acetobutylicum]
MDIRQEIIYRLIMIPAVLIGFTFHEYAHAIVADKLGDKTPRFQGRITLNPMAHLDPFGFAAIILVGFGYAKPVQTNPAAYKNYRRDDLKVSIAGPIANLIVAFVFSIVCSIFLKFLPSTLITSIIYRLIIEIVRMNCLLALFNLIPIPGFDGFHVLRDLFPKAIPDSVYRYGTIILLAVIFPIIPTASGTLSIANLIIDKPVDMMFNFFMKIAALI